MEFDDKIAADIVDKFGLDKKTINVWKTRNKIPDKYFKEGFSIEKKTKNEYYEQLTKDVKKIFSYGKLNINAFARLVNISNYKFKDFIYKDIMLGDDNFLLVKKAINKIRLDAKLLLEAIQKYQLRDENTQKKVKDFYKRKEIYFYNILEKNNDTYGKIESYCCGRRTFPDDKVSDIEHALLIFIAELSL